MVRKELPSSLADIEFTAGQLAPDAIHRFQQAIYHYFAEHERRLPWRDTDDPYQILVSEIMLQQTQVPLVLTKYSPFISSFPDFASLAQAPLRQVLVAWQGLGYNRRAVSLKRIAQQVTWEFNGRLPQATETLRTLPGIGAATAGALAAFAFHRPVVFIETNIRRVFLHVFFSGRKGVRDGEILPLIGQTLDRSRVRTWYYALMDCGAMLKTEGPNPNRRSAHHQRQAPFVGSDRQIRGLILKASLGAPALSLEELVSTVGKDPERVKRIIGQLVQEGFLVPRGNHLEIPSGPSQTGISKI